MSESRTDVRQRRERRGGRDTPAEAQRRVKLFNERNAVGAAVMVAGRATVTRAPACALGGRMAVVLVDGINGWVELRRVVPVDRTFTRPGPGQAAP